MRNFIQRKISAVLFAAFAAAFVVFPSSVDAQGWRLFVDDVKKEAKDERARENGVPTDASSDSTSDDGDSIAPDVPPLDPDAKTADANANVETPLDPNAVDPAKSLGDAEDYYPVDAAPSQYAPPLPSYRNFPEMKNDARLNDVCFVSPVKGWAVGDRGTIWTTVDGGANWNLADVPTDANLFAVSFFDENFGLAVGGRVVPATGVGVGVLLRTIDGGTTWGVVETASFPILRDVRILDPGTAWVAGDSSELYPSGLFVSGDTGLTWTAEGGARRGGWRSVLYDPAQKLGVGVSTEGALQTVSGEKATKKSLPFGARRLDDVVFDASSGTVWAVGERGLATRSANFGADWARAPGAFPNDAGRYFDLKSVAALDGFVGAVGSPGTFFFYSDDGGATWAASRTETRAPLRKLFFLDRLNGWAVGEFGTILATKDGGRTWTRQRDGGRRVALLGVFGRVDDVPFEALVQLAGDEGFLTEICLAARSDETERTGAEIPLAERLNEAVVETGASGAAQAGLFSLDPAENGATLDQILARFDRENDNDGLERFREYLVRQIRVWRPSVVLTADPLVDAPEVVANFSAANVDLTTGQGTAALLGALSADANRLDDRPSDPFRTLIWRSLPGAIQAAADPTAYPEHLTACGLEPWRVSKATLACKGKKQGNVLLDASYFCGTLGRPVGEIAKNAREILGADVQIAETTNFQTLFGAANATDGGASATFFGGVAIPRGSEARRAAQIGLSGQLDALSERAAVRRQKLGLVDALTRQNAKNRKSGELLLAQLRTETRGADVDFAIDYLTQAGRNFAKLGNWLAAEEAFSVVALDLAAEPKARDALTWLVQYYCGSEPAWRVQETNRFNETNVGVPNAPDLDATAAPGGNGLLGGVFSGNGGGLVDARSGGGRNGSLVDARSGGAAPDAFQASEEPVSSNPTFIPETPESAFLGTTPGSRSTLALNPSATLGPRLTNAANLGETLRAIAPETFMSPQIRFPLAAAQRARGDVSGALRYYWTRSIADRASLWGARAQAEYWLATPERSVLPNGETECPFATAVCRRSPGRPYLDGVFEPTVWDAAARFALTTPNAELPPNRELDAAEIALRDWKAENRAASTELGTQVSLLCDDRFLYVGVVCPKSASFRYPAVDPENPEPPRPRDGDLSTSDRVEFRIDLDGDYATAFEFAFDCRGWASDELFGDKTWNPGVFVAKNETNADWTLEIAIPFEALSARPPKSGDVWRFEARRIVPGVGVECWNVENSNRARDAFGFLTFE
ncbi:MAG: hypothetical protein J6K20_08060 [Thermoguttaceae bacterium]|nr:hypothetical protein [Thermoguttaceae bacterium]